MPRDLSNPDQRYELRDIKTLKVLVLGGSQGAEKLNKVVPETLSNINDDQTIQLGQ